MIKGKKIGFIGAGEMAESIVSGLLKYSKLPSENISLTNKNNKERLSILSEKYKLDITNFRKEVITSSDLVILAVKPKDMMEVLKEWGGLLNKNQCLISVVAGVHTKTIESFLHHNIPVIRAMPNTSSSIGQSATAICAGRWAQEVEIKMAEKIFSSIGLVISLEESLMDAVTGLSGSGPAYVYYMVEALEKAGIASGLSPENARALTIQTLFGAAQMLMQSGKTAKQLREEVTSPNGTTMVGIQTLNHYLFDEAVLQAVKQAKERASELGQECILK